jgi:hypothetical protein
MAALEFAPAAARARIVATGACHCRLQSGFFGGKDLHDLGRSSIPTQQFGHDLHRVVHVMEESLVSGAEVVQPRLAIGCLDEPVNSGSPLARERPSIRLLSHRIDEFAPAIHWRDAILRCI